MRYFLLVALLALLVAPAAAQDAAVEDRPFALEPLPANAEASRRLAGRVTLEAGEMTLPQIAAFFEREVGVTMRFDWDGLAELEVTPETSVQFEAGEVDAERMLSMVLFLIVPEAHDNYPTYMLIDGTVVVGTSRSLVRRVPQVNWPRREAQRRQPHANDLAARNMQRIVTVNFDEIGWGAVLDYIRDSTGANVDVNWEALATHEIFPDTQVTCVLRRVTAERLLQAVLQEVGGVGLVPDTPGYTFADGVVYISTQADIRGNMTTTQAYDVRDIVDAKLGTQLISVYGDDALAMELIRLRHPEREAGDRAFVREEVGELLIEMIWEGIGAPEEWIDEDSSANELNGSLVIKTTWHNHAEVVAMLAGLRANFAKDQLAFARELEVVRLLRRAEAVRAEGDRAAALLLVEEALAVDPLHETARALRAVIEEAIDRGGE